MADPARLIWRALLLLALVATAMLGAAHAFQHWGGLQPCLLCLKQRESWWLMLGVAVAGLISARWPQGPRLALAGCGLAAAAGAAMAGYHAGAEWGWWPGPAACAATGVVDVLALNLQAALDQSAVAPPCDQVQWALLGLSMAGWNGLINLAIALGVVYMVMHDER